MSKTYFFSRGLGLALLSLALFVVAGCQADNEATAVNEASTAATKAPSGQPETKPQPKDLNQYRQQQQQNDPYKAGGYPGTKK
jgi:hypothetical protein